MMDYSKEKVVVAMSGGVDSSVAAFILKQKGYNVTGIMLRTWTEPENECKNACCTPESMAAARKIAAMLDIPFYVLDAREYFRKEIVEFFIDGYRRGITPNPCVRCNQVVRWGFLLDEVRNMGANYLATGHYARITSEISGWIYLKRGLDANKDQSYVLSALSQDQLKSTLLPIGDRQKHDVREIARKNNLPCAEKKDSQDLCFLAGDDYREFLRRNARHIFLPGDILNTGGQRLGTHNGLPDYTIGQRKGLGAFQVPHYVLSKNREENTLTIGNLDELGSDTCTIDTMNWIINPSHKKPESAQIKIRYKAPPVPATILYRDNGSLCIKFVRKLRDITPGQQAVFYSDDICLGGGQISQVNSQ